MSVFGVFLVRIFPHSDWKTPNTNTFQAVIILDSFCNFESFSKLIFIYPTPCTPACFVPGETVSTFATKNSIMITSWILSLHKKYKPAKTDILAYFTQGTPFLIAFRIGSTENQFWKFLRIFRKLPWFSLVSVKIIFLRILRVFFSTAVYQNVSE